MTTGWAGGHDSTKATKICRGCESSPGRYAARKKRWENWLWNDCCYAYWWLWWHSQWRRLQRLQQILQARKTVYRLWVLKTARENLWVLCKRWMWPEKIQIQIPSTAERCRSFINSLFPQTHQGSWPFVPTMRVNSTILYLRIMEKQQEG